MTRQPYVTLLLRLHGNTAVERNALARRRAFSQEVAALLVAARDEGSVRRDIDPAVVARLLFGMINSIVEWYRPTGPEDADRLADDVLTIALEGLRCSDRLLGHQGQHVVGGDRLVVLILQQGIPAHLAVVVGLARRDPLGGQGDPDAVTRRHRRDEP